MALTPKRQKFVEVYAGNATEAARLAGFTGSDATLAQYAHELMQVPEVAEAIKAREAKASSKRIASRTRRQEFWTSVMESKTAEMRDRLKASELLGKSEADFVERLKHEGGVVVQVVDPYAEPKK